MRMVLPFLLAALPVLAREAPSLVLDVSDSIGRSGLEVSLVGMERGEMIRLASTAGLGVMDLGRRGRELRGFIGLGGVDEDLYLFADLMAAGGGPWSPGLGLRARGGWRPHPKLHLGAYVMGIVGATTRGELGVHIGTRFSLR